MENKVNYEKMAAVTVRIMKILDEELTQSEQEGAVQCVQTFFHQRQRDVERKLYASNHLAGTPAVQL